MKTKMVAFLMIQGFICYGMEPNELQKIIASCKQAVAYNTVLQNCLLSSVENKTERPEIYGLIDENVEFASKKYKQIRRTCPSLFMVEGYDPVTRKITIEYSPCFGLVTEETDPVTGKITENIGRCCSCCLLPITEDSEEKIDYKTFFTVCRHGGKQDIARSLQANPATDVNYQNEHGTTALLHAATYGKWDNVWYLLEKCGADKTLADKYGQTLFSKAVRHYSNGFKELLPTYSYEEINLLCKTIALHRNGDYKIFPQIPLFAKEVLEGKRDLEFKFAGQTALDQACFYNQIPYIVELLKRGASLKAVNNSKETPYDRLQSSVSKAPLFVVREAFNNGPCSALCIPTTLINALFNSLVISAECDPLNDAQVRDVLPQEISTYIKQLYVELKMRDSFASPQARLWKYVCADACAIAGIEKIDKKTDLVRILLLPQEKLTKINVQLALQDK